MQLVRPVSVWHFSSWAVRRGGAGGSRLGSLAECALERSVCLGRKITAVSLGAGRLRLVVGGGGVPVASAVLLRPVSSLCVEHVPAAAFGCPPVAIGVTY